MGGGLCARSLGAKQFMKKIKVTEKDFEQIPIPSEEDEKQTNKLIAASYALWNSIIILNGFLITISSVFLSISKSPENNFFLFAILLLSFVSCLLIFRNYFDAKRSQKYFVSVLNPNFKIETKRMNKILNMGFRLHRNEILSIIFLSVSFLLFFYILYYIIDIRFPKIFLIIFYSIINSSISKII